MHVWSFLLRNSTFSSLKLKIDLGASYRHENLYGHHYNHSRHDSGLCDAYGVRGTDPATSRAHFAPAEQAAASHPG